MLKHVANYFITILCFLLIVIFWPGFAWADNTSVVPVYQTDFESASIVDSNRINMGLTNWFEFGPNSPAAKMWLENSRTHSGTKSIGLEWLDKRSRRAEFNIYPSDLVGKDWSMSFWYFCPDWSLHTSYDWSWWEWFVPMSQEKPSPGTYWISPIMNHDTTKNTYNLLLILHEGEQKTTIAHKDNYKLPENEWFNVHYYVKRDPQNGVFKMWINGESIFDLSNLATETVEGPWKATIGKVYYEVSEPEAHRVWVDDLKIWNGFVAPESTKVCPADLNNDRVVNLADANFVLNKLGACTNCVQDFNADQIVNLYDLNFILTSWGNCD
ncbi:hypothetical protein GYA49_00925 [Candidatus Beckwithbacteria bacterium]|nr:hypothetical protein [Candidatus Beckwithbacteria bacterium]